MPRFLQKASVITLLFSCRATNALGQAETTANVQVVGKHTIISDVQHPQSWQRIQEIEAPRLVPEAAPTPSPEAPRFTVQIEDQERYEGQPAHWECRVNHSIDSLRADAFIGFPRL